MGLNAKICLHLTFRIWGVNALRAFSLKILNAINAKFSHQVCKKHQKASYNKHAKLKKNSSELLSLKAYWSSHLKKNIIILIFVVEKMVCGVILLLF